MAWPTLPFEHSHWPHEGKRIPTICGFPLNSSVIGPMREKGTFQKLFAYSKDCHGVSGTRNSRIWICRCWTSRSRGLNSATERPERNPPVWWARWVTAKLCPEVPFFSSKLFISRLFAQRFPFSSTRSLGNWKRGGPACWLGQ